MTERALIQRLERAIQQWMSSREARSGEPEIDPLLEVARELHSLPRPAFRAELRQELERRANMLATERSWIPAGFTSLTPYLALQGSGIVDFLHRVFGAEETFAQKAPSGGVHREVRIGDSMLMIGEMSNRSRPALLSVFAEDLDAAYRRAVDLGATSLQPPADQHYGARVGGVRDAWGNEWIIMKNLPGSDMFAGCPTVMVGLHPKGAPAFIEFAKRAFGAVEHKRFESPEGRIVHAQIYIGDTIIGLGEPHGDWQPKPTWLVLYVSDCDTVYRQALAAGAKSVFEPVVQEYGVRASCVEDAWGNQWFISTHLGKPAA